MTVSYNLVHYLVRFMLNAIFMINVGRGEGMVKGYINCIVSKHFYGWALGGHIHEDETHNFYNVLNNKLEDLALAGNLPVFTGYYTEYLDENETHNKLDYKFILKNYLNRN